MESGSDPCDAQLPTMCSLNFCNAGIRKYHISQRGGAHERLRYKQLSLGLFLFLNGASIQCAAEERGE